MVNVVRPKVLAAFQAICAGGDCCETVLLKDRQYVGRRFRQGGFEAIWLAGERLVSIFNEDGDLIQTIRLDDAVPMKQAA